MKEDPEGVAYTPASRWQRLAAVYLDSIGSGGLALIVLLVISWAWNTIQDAGPGGHGGLSRLGWFFISFPLLWTAMALIAGSISLATLGSTPGQRLCWIETRMLNGTPLSARPLRACARSVLGAGEMIFFIASGISACHFGQFSVWSSVCPGYTGIFLLAAALPVLLFGGRTLSERATGVWTVRRPGMDGSS